MNGNTDLYKLCKTIVRVLTIEGKKKRRKILQIYNQLPSEREFYGKYT